MKKLSQKDRRTVVLASKPEARSAFIHFALLETAFYKGALQFQRIQHAKRQHDTRLLFADIHFFLVTISNVLNLLKSFRHLLNFDAPLVAIYKKYLPALEYLDTFRDHLEHITDGRLSGLGKKRVPLKTPNMLGNLFGDYYDFGGDNFSLECAKNKLLELQKELKVWGSRQDLFSLKLALEAGA